MSDGIFSGMEKIQKNINGLVAKQYELTELRICELYELAGEMLSYASVMRNNELRLCEALSLIGEELNSCELSPPRPKNSLPENESRLAYAAHTADVLDKAVLAELFCERSDDYGVKVSESEILESTPRDNSFVYVKNAYSDEAYEVLTENAVGARVKYVNSTREAAVAIFEGNATYCILPLEEHSVRIASVSELMAAYDLKINRVTSVFGFDGTADMKYAMLSHSYAVPSREAGDDRYLEIRHSVKSPSALSDIIFAASAYGHKIYRVNTVSALEDGEQRLYYSLVLRDDERDFSAMLVYLSLFSPDTAIVGMYKNLE